MKLFSKVALALLGLAWISTFFLGPDTLVVDGNNFIVRSLVGLLGVSATLILVRLAAKKTNMATVPGRMSMMLLVTAAACGILMYIEFLLAGSILVVGVAAILGCTQLFLLIQEGVGVIVKNSHQ